MIKWQVILLDNSPGHDREEVNITRWVDLKKSRFEPTAQGVAHPSSLWVTFPKTESFVMQEGMELWAGHRDLDTLEWQTDHPVYGGYIGVQTGKGRGTRRRFPIQVDEYDFDLETTAIDDIWPDVVVPGNGVPPGESATDWLINGGTGYTGLIVQYLAGGPGVDLTGVDSAFDSIVFDSQAMPGLAAREFPTDRYFGVCMLRDALNNIIEVIKFYADTMDPVAYMEPVIDSTDPTRLRPRFRLADKNSTAGSVWATYSSEPIGGEYWIFNGNEAFGHTRDNREARQRIIVKGAGTQTTGTSTPGDLIMGTAYDSSRAIQRTVYQSQPGRALIYQSDDLGTKADCEQLASRFESLLYGAIGQLVLPVDHYAPPGAIIEVNIPEEGQTYAKYRVNEVNTITHLGHPMWELVVGAERPDLANLFTRLTRYISGVRQLQKLGLKPGAVPSSPIYSNPGHSQQNVTQAQGDEVIAHTYKPGYIPPDATPSATPADQVQHLDAAGNVRQAFRADGVDATIRLPFDFPAAGNVNWLVDDPGTIERIIITVNTVAVTLTEIDTGVLTNPDLYLRQTPPTAPTLITAGTPLPILEGHLINVAVDGACTLTFSGRKALL